MSGFFFFFWFGGWGEEFHYFLRFLQHLWMSWLQMWFLVDFRPVGLCEAFPRFRLFRHSLYIIASCNKSALQCSVVSLPALIVICMSLFICMQCGVVTCVIVLWMSPLCSTLYGVAAYITVLYMFFLCCTQCGVAAHITVLCLCYTRLSVVLPPACDTLN